MKCAICKHGICKHGICEPGNIAVTLERESTTVVIKQITAIVCNTSGEEYLNEEITDTFLSIAEYDVKVGILEDIRGCRIACTSI